MVYKRPILKLVLCFLGASHTDKIIFYTSKNEIKKWLGGFGNAVLPFYFHYTAFFHEMALHKTALAYLLVLISS